jgi:hypothetical protein
MARRFGRGLEESRQSSALARRCQVVWPKLDGSHMEYRGRHCKAAVPRVDYRDRDPLSGKQPGKQQCVKQLLLCLS